MRYALLRVLGLALGAAILAGCASSGGIISSLEDLSTDSEKEGLFKIPQYRVASIPGWLPFADVGGLYFYKPSRKPASVIGLSPGNSFELVSEIPSDCDLKCLVAIRDEVTSLGSLAQELVQSRVDVLYASVPAKAGDTPDRTAITAATTAHRAVQTKFNTAYEKVVKSMKDHGVLIYRWSLDSSQSASVGAGSLLNAGVQENQKRNGFALVSGVRTKTLFVGADLLKAWPNLDTTSGYSNRFEMTTHIMQAKHILYGNVSDAAVYAQAKLEASYQQLANLPETLKTLTNIEVGMALSRVTNLSNIGVMGGIKRTTRPVAWTEAALRRRLADSDWLTFYSVESDFTDLLDLLKKKAP